MKRILTVAITSLMSLSATAADWLPLTQTAYILMPAEAKQAQTVAMANLNGDQINITLVDYSNAKCRTGEDSGIEESGPFKINGTNVRFQEGCINGNHIYAAVSPAGKEFLRSALTKGPAVVEMNFGVVLHFNSEHFEATEKLLQATKSAL